MTHDRLIDDLVIHRVSHCRQNFKIQQPQAALALYANPSPKLRSRDGLDNESWQSLAGSVVPAYNINKYHDARPSSTGVIVYDYHEDMSTLRPPDLKRYRHHLHAQATSAMHHCSLRPLGRNCL